MKTTGVVRRIDDLGRIVIPKEIRKSMRIREGESLEIFSGNQNEIILKKYSFVESIEDFSKKVCEAFYTSTKKDIIITDNEKIISAYGGFNQKIIGMKISNFIDKIIQNKEIYVTKGENIEISDNFSVKSNLVIRPILIYGDVIGSIIIFTDNKSEEVNIALANYLNNLMSKYFEE